MTYRLRRAAIRSYVVAPKATSRASSTCVGVDHSVSTAASTASACGQPYTPALTSGNATVSFSAPYGMTDATSSVFTLTSATSSTVSRTVRIISMMGKVIVK